MKNKLLVVIIVFTSILVITACAGNSAGTGEKDLKAAVSDTAAQSQSDSDYSNSDDGLVFQDTEGGVMLFRYEGNADTVVVPETYQGKSVVEIGMGAFVFCDQEALKSVTLPDSVTVIGESAFGRCQSLTNINIPNQVKVIDFQAFASCTSLESINIPGSVTRIERWAFMYCENLKSVDIQDGVTEIGEKAFQECKSLEQIIIPSSVVSIGKWAFDNCESLSSIDIGEGVTTIDDYAFGDCINLTSVTLPDSITALGKAFHGCDNIAVTYKGVTYTDDNMDDLYKQFEQG